MSEDFSTSPPPEAAAQRSPVDPARRQFVFGGAMLAAALGAVVLTPRTRGPLLPPGTLDRAVPTTIGPWRFETASGLVLPPQDETESRTYDQVLTRVYTNDDGGLPVMLLIAYGGNQTGLLAVHRPEACYPAQGYRLSGRHTVTVPVAADRSVEGVFWSAHGEVRNEQLLYWTRVGDAFPDDWWTEHYAVISANLKRELPDGVLVRMSIASDEPAIAIGRLESFARALVASVGPVGRVIMLGKGSE